MYHSLISRKVSVPIFLLFHLGSSKVRVGPEGGGDDLELGSVVVETDLFRH